MKTIPIGLVILRFLISPLLLWDALDHQISIWFLVSFVAAFLSDIFDGIIARKLQVSTAQLRQADSWADVCLYTCIAASAWIVHQEIILHFRWPLLSVIGVQLVWWIVNLAKYGKPASYHTYSAKIWGLTLFVATVALFGFNQAGIFLWLTIIMGIIHTLEEIAMTVILPEWKHDIPSFFHALQLKQE
jgi:cardiolipin synthase (CMP-forming)